MSFSGRFSWDRPCLPHVSEWRGRETCDSLQFWRWLRSRNAHDCSGWKPNSNVFSPHVSLLQFWFSSYHFQPQIVILVLVQETLGSRMITSNKVQPPRSTSTQPWPWMTSICSRNLPQRRQSSAPGRAPRAPRSPISTPTCRGARLHRVGPAAAARWIWPSWNAGSMDLEIGPGWLHGWRGPRILQRRGQGWPSAFLCLGVDVVVRSWGSGAETWSLGDWKKGGWFCMSKEGKTGKTLSVTILARNHYRIQLNRKSCLSFVGRLGL